MTFSKTIFFVGILPWFILFFQFFKNKKIWTRSICLLMANSLFIIWGGIGAFFVLCLYSVGISFLAFLVYKIRRKAVLAVCIFFSALPLLFFKYSIFLIENINAILKLDIKVSIIVVPMGISFVTFEAVSLLVDIFQNKIKKNPNLLYTYLYLTFFPTVSSGPIIRYNEFVSGLNTPSFSCDAVISLERIVLGLCKKVLIADKISILANYYFDGIAAGHNYSSIGLWIGSVAYTLQLYFDFSGYSDIAIGIGELLGFNVRKNFDKPYQATSISMFWKKWHMSLTQWFRDYIYIPLGGNRCSKPRHIVNMLTVWMLTGIWHGADWSFLVWGLGYFILLVSEKYIPLTKKFTGRIIGHIYTLFWVNLLWIPFRANNLGTALQYIKGMFGGGIGGIEDKAIRFMPAIFIAILLCINWDGLLSKLYEKTWFKTIKGVLFIGFAFLMLCAAVNSVYAPYIYGNF